MKLLNREQLARRGDELRAQNQKIVFTNGCFDVLHSGHVELLQSARALGDFLIVGLNSDASVRRLKGASRPINDEAARAFVLAALECVDAICIFDEDTPVETLELIKPQIHVKGGDYQPDDLPESATVKKHGGEIHIVPLRAGFSTTRTLEKLKQSIRPSLSGGHPEFRCTLIIPARWASTRFPGKPLEKLGAKTVLEHVVAAALQAQAERPILVATDDARIAGTIEKQFALGEVQAVMTSADCATGTDRLAEVLRTRFADESGVRRAIINLQGDEPFINPRHVDALIDAMRADENLDMATLATPLNESQNDDPNVVKVVLNAKSEALYFSRAAIPFARDALARDALARDAHEDEAHEKVRPKLRHLGVYAYSAQWLLQMAQLPPSPLEETEKLEQLRALENGARIKVVVVENVVNIAIDTPRDLEAAREFLEKT